MTPPPTITTSARSGSADRGSSGCRPLPQVGRSPGVGWRAPISSSGRSGVRGDGGGRERRPRAEGNLRLRRDGVAPGADAHRTGLAALALAGTGPEAGVALEALDVREVVRDGVLHVVDADVLAGADDGLVR